MNFKISDEQQKIINYLKANYNLKIEAVAGSGKTTTSLFIADAFKDKNIIILTYNKKLADETNKKIKKHSLTNIKCKTFHSFIGNCFGDTCKDDQALNNIIINKIEVIKNLEHFDLLILDEVQDMSFNIFKPLVKIIKEKYFNSQLCILGDSRQSIYSFRGANPLFLSKAEIAFGNLNNFSWKSTKLSTSYRITKDNATFLNEVYFNENFITSNQENSEKNLFYTVIDAFNTKALYEYLKPVFEKYEDEDIFILSNKVQGTNTPLSRLATLLSEKGHLVYISLSEEENLSDKELKNKIAFSTIHQSKGRERKVAIIFSMEHSYFEYYDRNSDHMKPSNLHYVALTRETEKTIIINHYKNSAFKFLNFDNLNKFIDFKVEEDKKRTWEEANKSINRRIENTVLNTSVSDLLKFLPLEKLREDLDKMKVERFVIKPSYSLEKVPNSKTFFKKKKEYSENLSIFNGKYFPIMFLEKVNKFDDIIKSIKQVLKEISESKSDSDTLLSFLKPKKAWVKSIIDEYENKNINILKVVLLLSAIENEDISRINQIQEIDWITKKDDQTANDVFEIILGDNAGVLSKKFKFEYNIKIENINGRNYIGILDCVDFENKRIWEFKFTNELSNIHRLQLLLYKLIISKNSDLRSKFDKFQYYLFNLKKNKVERISMNYEDLERMFYNILFIKENMNTVEINLDSFLDEINKIKEMNYFI
ncbi:UvrD-helicase domain-containing protein [Spiroplasma apis]|uniref:Uncharacterized protein n=1 Tax=Spiroplasma apis B31 TaxID=1276258 RepID=V5RIH6_SPIAP|nr:UvrD-helicase domain-containing protein [Spiroplasma apis]AHB36278.1 hypothetical protein SAPIS_v1c04330 [Spiroplasma apis B31]